MANSYRGGDRSQSFLLPPDVRDWLAPDHLAWLVIELVEAIDTSSFHAHARRGGAGRAGFDPDVLLALLIYAYAVGQRSSRRIEQLCETDVACRVITGNEVPDHSVIARFRQRHQDAFVEVFVQLLGVCAGQGMGQVGTIALDGTKIAADASRTANRTRGQLRAEVDAIVAEAAQTDVDEDQAWGEGRGDELPAGLVHGADRVGRLRACLEELDQSYPQDQPERERSGAHGRVDELQQQVDRMQAQRAAYEAECAARDGKRRSRGQAPQPPVRPSWIERKQQALDRAQARLEQLEQGGVMTAPHEPTRNPTDPDSRILRCQGAWVQGYNAQAAVSADGLIVACEVTNNASDSTMLVPMIDRLHDTLAAAAIDQPVRALLADAGYFSADNLDASGPPRLIPPPSTVTNLQAQQMRRRLEQPAMARLYQRRQRVEAAFGRIKHNQGITRFTRRGLDAARSEWHLIATVHNLQALHRRRRRGHPD